MPWVRAYDEGGNLQGASEDTPTLEGGLPRGDGSGRHLDLVLRVMILLGNGDQRLQRQQQQQGHQGIAAEAGIEAVRPS